MVNRREFLIGLAACAAVPMLPMPSDCGAISTDPKFIGQIVAVEITGEGDCFLNMVIVVPNGIYAVTGITIDGNDVPIGLDGHIKGKYQEALCLVTNQAIKLDSDLWGPGVARMWEVAKHQDCGSCACVQLKYDKTLFPEGIPHIALAVRGKS